jgi:membrane-bound lytic murein transglycosylase D
MVKQGNFRPHFIYFIMGALAAAGIIAFIAYLFILPGTGQYTFAQEEDNKFFPQGYKIISPDFPDDLSFAGEPVPLDHFEVYERTDREFLTNTYWHSATILSIKRANRWFPLIETILKKNGVPDDFKYIAVIESGLANAISPAGATGFWQFMEGTGLEYGLEINKEVDERYNVEKSTEAACRYLWNAYRRFGSWTLAAASYNMGMNGVERQLNRQRTRNYYNLLLNEETSRYMFRVLALKEIMSYPEKYGFMVTENKKYPPLRTVDDVVSTSIPDLIDYSIRKGYNFKILRYYNPWLRDSMLNNKAGKSYTIKFPEEGSITLIRD